MAEAGVAGWERLGAVAPAALATARLDLHRAANVVAAAGNTLLPARGDGGQAALTWLADDRAIAGERLPSGARAALRFDPFELYVAGDGSRGPGFPLTRRTVSEALAWLGDALGAALTPPSPSPTTFGPVGAPAGRFCSADIEARRELGRWFGDAALALAAFAALDVGSPIRVWPHHFDIATLLTLGGDGEAAQTIGVGLSPGDESYGEPYWYVTPWPKPTAPREPPLRAGRWHTERWFGAVLPASSLLAASGDQASLVDAFLSSAVAAGRSMLER